MHSGETAHHFVSPTKTRDNDEYIVKIRQNLEENAAARAEREKRRRKVLVDQLRAHEAQEVSFDQLGKLGKRNKKNLTNSFCFGIFCAKVFF